MKLAYTWLILYLLPGAITFGQIVLDNNESFPEFSYKYTQKYSCGGQTNSMKIYIHQKTGMKFVLIPAGSFLMGNKKLRIEPVHKVTIKSFLMSQYEVTQKVWQQVIGQNPSYFRGDSKPVENVSWDDVQKFCQKTGLELPSESQWEYACRAGTNSLYYWGNAWNRNMINSASYWAKQDLISIYDIQYKFEFYSKWKNLGAGTTEVGKFPPNAFGLYDILGNVMEWCLDTLHMDSTGRRTLAYKGAPNDGSAWVDKDPRAYKILRGASWSSHGRFCSTASRGYLPSYVKGNFIGFRVVKTMP